MFELGRLLLILGVTLALVGGLLMLGPQLPWLGRLPGDIQIERGGSRFYLPIATCLVLSVLISLLLSLWSRWR